MTAVIAAVWISLSSPVAAVTDSQTIYVTIVSRCDASLVLRKADAYRDGKPPTDIPIPLTRIGPYFYTGHVAVRPGRYGVGTNLHNKCFGGDEITVLPGHDRDIGIEVVPFGGTVWDANAFLSGTLPFKGFVRGTLSGRFGEEPIVVQGTAYYAERVSVGSYTLKLEYGDGLECRIPVLISSYNEIKRLDISVQQMQQCIGYPYHYPETGESGFIYLYRATTPKPTHVNLSPSPPPSSSSSPPVI